MKTRGNPASGVGRTLSAGVRRRILRRYFDQTTEEEWQRYSGRSRRVLARTLRERFLCQHLAGVRGIVLELGPGPGRFTPVVSRPHRTHLVGVDLSREALVVARKRARRLSAESAQDWVQAAGEQLPLASHSISAAVVLGNILGFASGDGPRILKELARVLRRRGVLVADLANVPGALQDALYHWALRRALPRILRRGRYYYVDRVMATGFLPYNPPRGARWEVKFYTVPEISKELARAGFRTVDAMAVAPIAAFQDRIASAARRDTGAWKALLRIEERVGRRADAQGVGHGFLIAAVRK
jgi:SAM-dependent methyltransferase